MQVDSEVGNPPYVIEVSTETLFISSYGQGWSGQTYLCVLRPATGWREHALPELLPPRRRLGDLELRYCRSRIGSQEFKVNKYSISHEGERRLVLYWYQPNERIIASEYLDSR